MVDCSAYDSINDYENFAKEIRKQGDGDTVVKSLWLEICNSLLLVEQ